MIKEVKKVTVKYNERIVGYLAEIKPLTIAFQYDDEWIKNGFSISPLSLPLDNKVYVSKKEQFNGLYGVFWDSLPDGWGELLMNRVLQKKGINPNQLPILTKLSLINNNGLGGLTYEPSQSFKSTYNDLDFDKLSDEVQKILNDESESVDLDFVYKLGGSSGGARPKAHIKIDKEEWIVKFACRIDPPNVGEKEFNKSFSDSFGKFLGDYFVVMLLNANVPIEKICFFTNNTDENTLETLRKSSYLHDNNIPDVIRKSDNSPALIEKLRHAHRSKIRFSYKDIFNNQKVNDIWGSY